MSRLKNGSILCGDVGSGKSRTALSYFYFRVCDGRIPINGEGEYVKPTKPKDLYIITTARKRDTFEWELECAPFLLSKDETISPDIHLVVDSWNNIQKYTQVKDAFFIFDEQRVVGKGVWVKSFLKITKSNEWILLSATPGDTWSDYIPVFIANGFYKNRTDFERQHVVWSRYTKFPKIERYIGTGRLIRLRREILVNMDFQRSTVMHKETIICDYNKFNYDRVYKDRWDIFKDEPIKDVSGFCVALRKIVNQDPSRLITVLNLYEQHPKMIIFYNFNYELDLLENLCFDADIPYAQWNGHKHEPIPKTDTWLYLVQYTAGAEGWNCIETDTILFYSLSYSYKAMIQAAGRINRMNTPFKDLYLYYLRSNSTIDIAIERTLKRKRNFNEKDFKPHF